MAGGVLLFVAQILSGIVELFAGHGWGFDARSSWDVWIV